MYLHFPEHKTKYVFDFFQCECFSAFPFSFKKNLTFRWLDPKWKENVEKEQKRTQI